MAAARLGMRWANRKSSSAASSCGCHAAAHHLMFAQALSAATRGLLEEARAAVLESVGAPGKSELIVYAGCNA